MNHNLTTLFETIDAARNEIRKVIIGQDEAIDMALITIFVGEHALIEGVPGIAKTLLVRTLSAVLDSPFSRIQFTPDLMPTDITGTHVFNMKENEFRLVKGPIFGTFVLADEINRAPAKTQSALLQAMQERNVSIDADTHALSPNFTVFATQNPIEYEGTYPLPEAQKDRFMLKIRMGYPAEEEEKQLANKMLHHNEQPQQVLERGEVKTVISEKKITEIREAFEAVTISDDIVNYIVDIIRTTRTHSGILVGAGPRATSALVRGARAYAAFMSRDFVTPDDVKTMALHVVGHRLVLRPEFEIEGLTIEEVIGRILEEVTVPQ